MSEVNTIDPNSSPLTMSSLVEQFSGCGLRVGQTVIVHSAMSKLGWVCGGPVAVIEALLEVLGTSGTLVMPSHTDENSDPAAWQNPPVPESWWPVIRESMPAFEPAKTPTRGMGRIAETFRTWPGVMRSLHPTSSFATCGPNAVHTTSEHDLENALGDRSPLGKLYELDASILLLGVGHENNTSLHLAEVRAELPNRRYIDEGSAMLIDGEAVGTVSAS